MEGMEFRKASHSLRSLWSAGNSYLEEKAPWHEIKTDPEAGALTLRTAMNLIHLYAVVSEPYIPTTCAVMRDVFDGVGEGRQWVTAAEAEALDFVPAGATFTVPPVLFAKLTDDDLDAYRERFGGDDA